MYNNFFQLTYILLLVLWCSFSAAAQEEEEEIEKRKVSKNDMHFFHQYSLEHSVAEFDNNKALKAKTAFSTMPIFGLGIKKETPNYVFAFSSRFGIQRDNMTFTYGGKKLAGTYCMDYVSVKRQFALGFRLTPQQTFSFLFIGSFNFMGVGATPLGEKLNLRKLEQKDKIQISTSENPFLNYRVGFEYELKPLLEEKLKMFWHIEASLTQRHINIAPNHNLKIYESNTLYYRLYVIGFGFRF